MLRSRFLNLWESVRSSYWFVPSLMAAGACLLASGLLHLDETAPDEWLEEIPWLYTGTAEGARSLLAAIASSMIGVAGVVFSIAIVSLTLASNQFGPRLLRNFMRDTGNQITLGTFLSAFLYCLLVLRKVQGSEANGGAFVPQISLLVSLLMAIASIGVLIYFIHHAAESIQAPHVITSVSHELMTSIRQLFPKEIGSSSWVNSEEGVEAVDATNVPDPANAVKVSAPIGGYIQRIESDHLLSVARDRDLLMRVEHRPGQFVQPGDPLLSVWPALAANDATIQELQQTFSIGRHRSPAQDVEFAIEQLVEVAVRALSPGINDPFTAMQCIDSLGEALSLLATRHFPSPVRRDDSGQRRVIAYPKSFGGVLDASYNQIRQYGGNSPDVLLRMLEAMARIAHRIHRSEDGEALAEHAEMVYSRAMSAARQIGGPRDFRKIEKRYEELRAALKNGGD